MIIPSLRTMAALLLLSFSPVTAPAAATAQPNISFEERCAVPSGWSAVAARRTQYIVFGEVHGTRESPAFMGMLACGLASSGERLLIAIEQEATNNAALQKAWLLPDSQFAAALREIGWAGRKDGVASEAMFELLQRLHRLRFQGRAIDIVAFNGFRDEEQRRRFSDLPAQEPHEAAQAENIRTAAESGQYDHVLVLVGNLHARKVPVERGNVSFKPMAMHLGPSVTSLNMKYSGGSMWNCIVKPGLTFERGKPIPDDAVACGDHATAGTADLHDDVSIALDSDDGEDALYDGYYWLGAVVGSPPAIP